MTRHWGPRGAAEAAAVGVDRDWWRAAVICRICPRSFEGTLRDGVVALPPYQGLFALELE